MLLLGGAVACSGGTATGLVFREAVDGATGAGVTAGSADGDGTAGAPSLGPLPGLDANVWLHTDGNHIRRHDGSIWTARGLNFPDMRGCGSCLTQAPNAALSIAAVDEMVDHWGAKLLRMALESHAAGDTLLQNAAYLDAVKAVVDHVASKPDVYIMLTVFLDPGLTGQGWPTASVATELARLATVFADYPCVILAPSNEPNGNDDQAQDPQVWAAMNAAVAAVRAVEDGAGKPHHLVAVQGTGGWARYMSYYIDHPIAADGGDNVIYESHSYLAQADFDRIWGNAAKVRPVLIGEYGPLVSSADDIKVLEQRLADEQIPSMMWTFHPRCGPLSMLADDGGNVCDPAHVLPTSAWGSAARQRLPQLQAMDILRAQQP